MTSGDRGKREERVRQSKVYAEELLKSLGSKEPEEAEVAILASKLRVLNKLSRKRKGPTS